MIIDKFNSYKNDLKTMRMILICLIIGSFLVIGFMYYQNLQFLEKKSHTVILVDQENNTLLATEAAVTRSQRVAQLQNHVEDFYSLFFEFDAETFNDRIEAALRLIGEDGPGLYQKYYVASTFERNIKENNWVLYVDVKSVEIDMSHYPYSGKAIATQTLETSTYRKTRNLNATFKIRNAEVSYNNPVGALIEDFELVNNEIIETESLIE